MHRITDCCVLWTAVVLWSPAMQAMPSLAHSLARLTLIMTLTRFAEGLNSCVPAPGHDHEDDSTYEACYGWCNVMLAADHCGDAHQSLEARILHELHLR